MNTRPPRYRPFPRGRRPAIDISGLRSCEIALRAASSEDLPVLAGLYAQLRMPELLFTAWPQGEKRAFFDAQFRLQHDHFVRQYPRADFWVALRDEVPVGRLYLDRSTLDWRIIDILLAPAWRERGIGSRLIAWVQQRAIAAGARGIGLAVAVDNRRAHALYARLGFSESDAGDGLHQPMWWQAPSALSA